MLERAINPQKTRAWRAWIRVNGFTAFTIQSDHANVHGQQWVGHWDSLATKRTTPVDLEPWSQANAVVLVPTRQAADVIEDQHWPHANTTCVCKLCRDVFVLQVLAQRLLFWFDCLTTATMQSRNPPAIVHSAIVHSAIVHSAIAHSAVVHKSRTLSVFGN